MARISRLYLAPAVIPVTILPRDASDAGEAVGGRPEPSADLLRQLDDDPLRAADVAEPIAVFVALHLAHVLHALDRHALDASGTTVSGRCRKPTDQQAPVHPRARIQQECRVKRGLS
jgi:hypothetical protein